MSIDMSYQGIFDNLVQKYDEIVDVHLMELEKIECILKEKGLDCCIKGNSIFFSGSGLDFYIDNIGGGFLEINHVINKDSSLFKALDEIKSSSFRIEKVAKIRGRINRMIKLGVLTEVELIDGSYSYAISYTFYPIENKLATNVKLFIRNVFELYKKFN